MKLSDRVQRLENSTAPDTRHRPSYNAFVFGDICKTYPYHPRVVAEHNRVMYGQGVPCDPNLVGLPMPDNLPTREDYEKKGAR